MIMTFISFFKDFAGLTGLLAVAASIIGVLSRILGWSTVWRLLTFAVPVPAIVIAGAVVFFSFDKTTAVRTAVDKAVTELVAGEELAAAKAAADIANKRAALATRIMDRQRARADAAEQANREFEAALSKADDIEEEIRNEIMELQASATGAECDVSDGVFSGLRSNKP